LKRWTSPYFVPFLLLLFTTTAWAQTTHINPQVCVHINNCVLTDTYGNTVWSDITYNGNTGQYQGFLEYGKYPNYQEYTNLLAYPVSGAADPNPADANPIIYSVEFKAPNGTSYTQVLKGYSYYYRGGGGRGGGGAGTRYAITSGSLTIR